MALALVDRPRRAEWTGPPIGAAVSRVRHELHQVLKRWRLPQDVIDDALLVITELLANVVEHAHTPFRVVAELRVRVLHLAVDDNGIRPVPAGTGCGASRYVSGLRLVSAVTLRWGWQERETGKTVWAEFPL